jgi:hypothetical protein
MSTNKTQQGDVDKQQKTKRYQQATKTHYNDVPMNNKNTQ